MINTINIRIANHHDHDKLNAKRISVARASEIKIDNNNIYFTFS